LAIGLYAALSVMQFCDQQGTSWNRTLPMMPAPTIAAPSPAAAVAEPSDQGKPLFNKIGYMARAALFRMSAAFPYYVQTFSDPDQRCGIVRPPLHWLPAQACFGPIKIFKEIYPDVTYATGFQPAPLNVSAFAEAGPWYALAATIICGLILGSLSALAKDASPISVSLTVACCVYAYYVSQTSLIGSLLDSYGLAWLLLPIVIMLTLAAALRARAPSIYFKHAGNADDVS
jgi:hypothetical protein